MLKCGQKNNKNYTYGIKREDKEMKFICRSCKKIYGVKTNYCPICGDKVIELE